MVLAVINSGSDNQELSLFMHLLMFLVALFSTLYWNT